MPDSTDNLTRSRASEQPEKDETCRCSWSGAPNHDHLLSILSVDTPARTEDMFRTICEWTDLEHQDGEVSPIDWADFVAEHNWPDPVASKWTALCAGELFVPFKDHPEEEQFSPDEIEEMHGTLDRIDGHIAAIKLRLTDILDRLPEQGADR